MPAAIRLRAKLDRNAITSESIVLIRNAKALEVQISPREASPSYKFYCSLREGSNCKLHF
jgi:hypothetical protein